MVYGHLACNVASISLSQAPGMAQNQLQLSRHYSMDIRWSRQIIYPYLPNCCPKRPACRPLAAGLPFWRSTRITPRMGLAMDPGPENRTDAAGPMSPICRRGFAEI